MKKWRVVARLVASAVLVVSCLASCQAVFTFSPLKFLQRDPSSMGPEQQLTYAEQALESGDPDALAAAYAALAAAAADHPENAELQYMTAQLALELSGVGDAFRGLLAGLGGGGSADPLALSQDVFDDIDQTLLEDAAGYLDAAEAADAVLTPTDYLVGAVGLVIAGADGADVAGTIDTNPNVDRAQEFLDAGMAGLAADDPALEVFQLVDDALAGGGSP